MYQHPWSIIFVLAYSHENQNASDCADKYEDNYYPYKICGTISSNYTNPFFIQFTNYIYDKIYVYTQKEGTLNI